VLIWDTVCCSARTRPDSRRTALRNLDVDMKSMIWAQRSDSVMPPVVGGHAQRPAGGYRPKGLGLRLKYFSLFVLILCSAIGQGTTPGFGEEDKRWSFVFKNTPLSDVLDELCRTTGIDIVSNQVPTGRVVTKQYVDESIDEIIKDLFRGLSFALVWNKSEDGKDTVDVWILDSSTGQSAGLPRIDRPVPRTPALDFGRNAPSLRRTQEDTDESEEDADESPSRSAEPDGENEKEEAGSDGDSDTESAEDAKNQPADEPDDEGAEAGTSPFPIKTPDLE